MKQTLHYWIYCCVFDWKTCSKLYIIEYIVVVLTEQTCRKVYSIEYIVVFLTERHFS